MIRSRVVLAVVLGAAVAACQRAPQPAAAPPSTAAPVAQATTPAPAGPGVEPAPYALASPAPAAPETVAPAPAAPRASTRTRTRTAQASRGTATTGHRSERVERVDRAPSPEPLDIPADDARARSARDAESEREPAMAGEPNRDRLSLPAGTELQLVLENGLSSATSQVGDPVTARVARATAPDGRIVLPGGTVLKGKVYRADAAGRVKGKSRLAVDFDRIVVRGVEHRLDTTAIDVEGPDSHGKDAAIIGGSTVGGAIIGGILGGGSGAKKGAVVGVLGGTGAVLATRGKDVEIPAGSNWTVRVKDRVAL